MMMMTNLALLPILIPFVAAILLLILPHKIKYQRPAALSFSFILLAASLFSCYKVITEGTLVVTMGNWPVPFGISLVADMLAMLLVVTTTLILPIIILYSIRTISVPREEGLYYPLIFFMITGVNGSFLTGDIFNLFVFFEVMLMSSYGILVLGGTRVQLQGILKYLVFNVIASAFFIVSVAMLYGIVGTLNMADIANKLAQVQGDTDAGLISVIAIFFLFVFGSKAGIFPLFVWLPSSYVSAPMPILALFGGLLTKVGVYAILRTFSLFFSSSPGIEWDFLRWSAYLTIIIGVVGAMSYRNMKNIIIYNILIAIGVILVGFTSLTAAGMTGSIYYLIHDMLIKVALFMIIGVILFITGTPDIRDFSGLIARYPGLTLTFFIAMLGLAGIPPFSGFVGKLYIVKGVFESGDIVGGILILVSSLFVLLSLLRIFILGFWGKERGPRHYVFGYRQMMMPTVILVSITVIFGIGIQFVTPYVLEASNSLIDPLVYITAVLGGH